MALCGRRTRLRSAVTVTTVMIAAVAAGPAAVAASAPAPRAATPVAAGALNDPTPEEQEHLREVAGSIWTPELAAGWNMNSDVADVLSTATGEILKCSEAFALVPRPPGFLPGIGYLLSYWKNLRDYFLVVKDDRTYRACVVAAAANYRSQIEMASMGI
ncbi:hypothetical protein [Streptomyces camelliae]|uniref:Uncharacterized protein n=1 Tax=Streptomyces camelliae TaxID=3004093 RepID=A0ABY7NWZ7_9ACTN|nr:hypothetical protein [Streptomyces sp. HUAS 2-6]WBO62057.1 hypothetical protein O1G22_04010 [Streptomyces sp. HUAS 2-6]